jgi:DNA-binding XRE family transcriptional regulator
MAIDSEEIFAALPEARRKAIQARTDELIAEELTLAAIREARRRSQEAVAKKLGVQQPTVSKIEHQTDMYLSTLRSYIAALGGELQIIAQFPDRAPVHITNFKPLRKRRTAGSAAGGGGQSKGGTNPSKLGHTAAPRTGGQAKSGVSSLKQGQATGHIKRSSGKAKNGGKKGDISTTGVAE